jgi:primosomal replication protein N
MNRMVLSAVLTAKDALRFTPAGLPALGLTLSHEGMLSEDGQPRKVSIEIRAVGIGAVTQMLSKLSLGEARVYTGFLASGRNGRGLVLHITAVDAVD